MCYEKGVLQAHLDGELAEPEMGRVREHAAKCGKCNAILQELRDNAAFVDMSVGAYVETIALAPDTQTAWNKFAEKRARRRWERLVAFVEDRWFRLAAVAASLAFIFLVGTTMLDLWQAQLRPSSPATGERLGVTGSEVKHDRAGEIKDGEKLEQDRLQGASEGLRKTTETGSVEMSGQVPAPTSPPVPAENGDAVQRVPLKESAVLEKVPPGYGQDQGVQTQTFSTAVPPHVPVELTAVKEVYLTIPGKPPRAVDAAERGRVLAWYNAGIPTGSAQSALPTQETPAGAGLRIVLADATEILVSLAGDVLVEVRRPDVAYEIKAPELAKYLEEKRGEAGAGTEN